MFHAYILLTEGWRTGRVKFVEPTSERFLRDAVSETTKIANIGNIDGYNARVVRFFADTQNKCDILIFAKTSDSLPEPDFDVLSMVASMATGTKIDKRVRVKVVWAKAEGGAVESISNFLRGSKALTRNQYAENGNKLYVADGESFAFLDSSFDASDRAENVCIAIALAVAYQNTLDGFANDISRDVRRSGKGGEAYINRLGNFLSTHYFCDPINLRTKEISLFYAAYRDRQKIEELKSEIEGQLRLLFEMANLRKLKWLNRWMLGLTALGVGIAYMQLQQGFNSSPVAQHAEIISQPQITTQPPAIRHKIKKNGGVADRVNAATQNQR